MSNREQLNPATILIVDDEEPNRALIEKILEPDGYDLYFAEGGEQALILAEGISPDLIILDVMMPDMDGYEVCRNLRGKPGLDTVPIVMVTALADKESRVTGIASGADEFLSKPVDIVELRTRVRTVTRLNRVRKLLSERSKFKTIASRSSDGCLVVNRAGQITYANTKAQRISEGLRTGAHFLDAVSPDWQLEPAAAWETWPDVWNNWQAIRYLLKPASESSTAIWWQVEIQELDPPDPDKRICHISDVSSLLNRQRELWSFHAMLSHKFRTPLTGLMSGIDLIAMDATPENAEIIDSLQLSIHRLADQLESVLQYVNAPRLLQGHPHSISDFLDAAKKIGREARLNSMACEVADADRELRLKLSPQAADVILAAILDNSHRYHPQNSPTIRITVRRTQDQQAVITVIDDGIYIDPVKLPSVGQPYFQAEEYFTGQSRGMGIGLAMVSSILWECGGTLRVSNREDRPGVRLDLTLPIVN